MSRPAGTYCPFSPAEIKKCRTLLKWPQWKLAREIRGITGTKTKPVNVARWERGKGRPGLAVSLALVELFRPVWYGDTGRLEIRAWWASNAVLEKEIKAKGKKRILGQKWTIPLTLSGNLIDCPVPQWRPGRPKPKEN